MTKHAYPKRSVLKRAVETQSQPDSIPTEADEYGCDDPYAWVAEHKSSERWTWECDRAVRRTASQAQQGKQVTTKKVGCPVRYHLWLVNGRWVAGQTCNHMGHGVASPDKFTKLTPNAKAAVTQLCHTRAMCPMTIYLVLKDPSRSAAMNLDDTDRSTVTQRSVAREVDRLAALRRDNNLVHGIERLNVEHATYGSSVVVSKFPTREDQDYRLVICTAFQKQMLEELGDFLLLDSVHQIASGDIRQLTLMVVDETGRGIPVGYMLATSENAEAWVELIQFCFKGLERNVQDTVTISDCAQEIIKACTAVGAKRHLLCAFHLQQAILRKVKSCFKANTPVAHRREAISKIMGMTKNLRLLQTEAKFNSDWSEFEKALRGMSILHVHDANDAIDPTPVFLQYMNEQWKPRAAMWAAWGRQGASWHGHDTTNLIENYFWQQKYALSPRTRIPCGTNHAEYLVNTVVPYFAQRRYDLLAGLAENWRMRDTAAMETTKLRLLGDEGSDVLAWVYPECGVGMATVDGAVHWFCMADLSCTCGEAPPGWPCIHLEAAAEYFNQNVDSTMVKACVEYISGENLMKVGPKSYRCPTLASVFSGSKEGGSCTRTDDDDDVPWCTCTAFNCGGREWCPHLASLSKKPVDVPRAILKEDIRAFRRTRDLPQLDIDVVESVWRVQATEPRRFYAQDALNTIHRLAPLQLESEEAKAAVSEALSAAVSAMLTHSTELKKRVLTDEDVENDGRNAKRGSKRSTNARLHHPLKIP